MLSGEADGDMRGHCSAGQKALSSMHPIALTVPVLAFAG